MKWTPKLVDRLMLEMSAQAKSASWSDRNAEDRMRILTEIMKRYGWVRWDQHPPEVCNTAVAIAFHAPGTKGHILRLQVLGCLFAESHSTEPLGPEEASGPRRWLGFWGRHRSTKQPVPDTLPEGRVVREQAARLLDQCLADLRAETVFGTTRPVYRGRKLVYPELCCPNDLLWLRCALGTPEVDKSVQRT